MLDSMIYDKIVADPRIAERIEELVGTDQLRLVSTHVQRDQLLNITDPDVRERALQVLVDYVPTSVFVFDVSRLGQARLADEETCATYDRMAGPNRKHASDAILAVTAEREVDVIVTDDRRLRNRIAAEGNAVQVWDFARFEGFLHPAWSLADAKTEDA